MIKKITYNDCLKYEYLTKEYCLQEEEEKYYTSTQVHRHDKLFRDVLANKEEVCKLLKEYLNFSIKKESLVPYKTAFLTEDFQNRESDMVYKIKNEKVFILIEHQSKIDYSMSYRILNYSLELIRNFIRSEKIQNKNYEYPQIIPIVIYTGNKKWNANTKFSQIQKKYIEYPQSSMEMEYNLIDINQYSKEELKKSNLFISKAFMIEKCKTEEELLDTLEEIVEEVKDKKEKETLERIIKYILYKMLRKDNVQNLLQKLNKNEGGISMGLENLLKEIKGKARKEGKIEGKMEGKIEVMLNIAKSMLNYGEEEEKIKKYTGMTESQIRKIKKELNMA